MSKKKQWEPAGRARNTDDAKGKVRIQVVLVEPNPTGGVRAVKGNVTKTVTVKGAKVSDVMGAIHKALAGD